MPPQSPIPNENADRLLPRPSEAFGEGGPPAHKSGTGAIVGIIIILVLLLAGALYFWGALLNARNKPAAELPLIPASDSTTTTVLSTTTAQ